MKYVSQTELFNIIHDVSNAYKGAYLEDLPEEALKRVLDRVRGTWYKYPSDIATMLLPSVYI